MTFPAGEIGDYVMVRANGEPLYTLVNPVDDALMQITHVLRGEDLLSSTPRQLALWAVMRELGIAEGPVPEFGHLPYVMGEGNKKLSKRDPESSLLKYVTEGYLPEGMTNYLALLGWSLAEDRDRFSLQEMADAFEIERVNANPARFDLKKCTALNADWIRTLGADEFANRLIAYLQGRACRRLGRRRRVDGARLRAAGAGALRDARSGCRHADVPAGVGGRVHRRP